MAVRKLGIFLAVLIGAIGLFDASAAQAQNVPVPVTVCVVVGGVAFSAPTNSSLPPQLGGPASASGPVNYTFFNVLLACAGGLTGICTANSTGSTNGTSPTSGFSGTFGVAKCPTGQDCTAVGVPCQQCSGSVGGQAIDQAHPVPSLSGYSFTVGPVIVGSLNNVNCSNIVLPLGVSVGGVNNGTGAIVLVGIPDPTAGGGCFGLIGSNALIPAAPWGLQYCGLIVAGVAVIVD